MKHIRLIGILALAAAASGCAQNGVNTKAAAVSFPPGSAAQAVQSGPFGSMFSGEDLTVLEKGLTTVHTRKAILDQWTSKSGHRIRIDHIGFGKRQNGFFCMEAKVLVDEKEALPSSFLCRRGWWMIVPQNELAAVPEKPPTVEAAREPVMSKKTRPAAKSVPEKAYTIN
jgi:hypothetical protein